MKNVKIEIDSIVEDMDDAGLVENSDKTHSSAIGSMETDGEKITLSYTEKNDDSRVESEIVISEDSVSVKRSGSVKYDFLFSEGKTTSSLYSVPPYSFDTEIYTRRIRDELTSQGGRLTLIYDMTIGGAKKKTRMTISVSEI